MISFERALVGELEGSHGDRPAVIDGHGHCGGYTTLGGSTAPAFLTMAWERVAGNKGSKTPGVDRVSVARISSGVGVEEFLQDLRAKLKAGEFRPVPVRQVMIPKASGKLRKLGIPTVTDRVVQAALKLVLEPIFEADFKSCSYGFRPNRRAQDAVAEIHHFASKSYEWVLEADIEACFDMWGVTLLVDSRYQEGTTRRDVIETQEVHPGVQG